MATPGAKPVKTLAIPIPGTLVFLKHREPPFFSDSISVQADAFGMVGKALPMLAGDTLARLSIRRPSVLLSSIIFTFNQSQISNRNNHPWLP